MKIKLIIILLLAFILAACQHSIHEGVVIGKTHEPPRNYYYISYIYSGKVMIPITHTAYDDEDFILTVMGIKGKDTLIEDFYVDEKTYKCIDEGNVFNDTIPCSTNDD